MLWTPVLWLGMFCVLGFARDALSIQLHLQSLLLILLLFSTWTVKLPYIVYDKVAHINGYNDNDHKNDIYDNDNKHNNHNTNNNTNHQTSRPTRSQQQLKQTASSTGAKQHEKAITTNDKQTPDNKQQTNK